ALADHAHVLRQIDLAEVLRVVDLKPGDVDVDRIRDRVGRAGHLYRVRHDVDRATALHAGRALRVQHVHRDVDADGRAFRHAEEVNVPREILDRIDLEVAKNTDV